jgi:hypothetical protein
MGVLIGFSGEYERALGFNTDKGGSLRAVPYFDS